jgi:predicted ATP-grasp superfamily ATP-dependent carboligase
MKDNGPGVQPEGSDFLSGPTESTALSALKEDQLLKTPVLVLGWIPRIVAVIARSLHRHGVPVDVADVTPFRPVQSRAIRYFTRLPNPDRDPDNFVRELRQLIRMRGYSMLIPADDQAMTAMVRHYDEFRNLVYVACPPPQIANQVLNKIITLEAATKSGIHVPRTAVVAHSDQFLGLRHKISFPWVVKPAEKQSRIDEFKTRVLMTPDELASLFPSPREFNPPILVQEYCSGVGLGIEVLLHKGECLAVFQHRRLKELPYTGGYAVMAVSEVPDAGLVRASVSLLRALQWEGVAMVEFRVDPTDNRAVFMEVNGRYWGSISLPVLAGVDFPLYHWKLVHGEPIEAPSTYQVGVKWRWTIGYLVRIHWLLVAATYSAAARKTLLQDLRDFPADFSSSVIDPLLDRSDPMTAVFEALGTVDDLLRYDMKAFFRHRGSARIP